MPYIGFIGSCYQFTLLLICFVAIWLPGSPFTLANQLFSTHVNNCVLNRTLINSTTSNLTTTGDVFAVNLTTTINASPERIERIFFESPCYVYTSILVLLGGMALSRFGLWLTDLVIHQIIQENVPENKRGIIGGVQSSLNTVFDLFKYACVIALSDVTQYGYLVIISITAVFVAFCLYTTYVVIMCVGRKSMNEEKMKPTTEDPKSQEMIVMG